MYACTRSVMALTVVCDPMDYSLLELFCPWNLLTRILKSVAISSSGKTEGSKQGLGVGIHLPRNRDSHGPTLFRREQPVPSLTHFNKHFEIIGMILMSSLKALPLLNHLLPKIGSSVLKKTITSKHILSPFKVTALLHLSDYNRLDTSKSNGITLASQFTG